MDTIKYTQITEETQKLEIEGGGEKIEVIEESVEVINVAAAEVRKIEAAAAAQAEAIKARAAEAEGSAVEEETEAELESDDDFFKSLLYSNLVKFANKYKYE